MGNLFGNYKIIEILKNILCTLITTIVIAHFVISALDAPVAKTHIAYSMQGGGSLKTYPLQLT